jgi:hypothetical protein
VTYYYTAGNIPDAVQIVPMGITADDIREGQKWMNSELAGQLAKKRQWFYMQGFTQDGKDQVIFPKEKLLSDPFDDLHIHKVCFAYGTSPQRLLKQLNRATGEANQEAAEEEGTRPWRRWLVNFINFVIQRKMGYTECEIVMTAENEVDLAVQTASDTGYVKAGLRTINEMRVLRGEDARSEPEADMLLISTPMGDIPIAEAVKSGVLAAAQQAAKEQMALNPPAIPGQPGSAPGTPAGPPKPGGRGSKAIPIERGTGIRVTDPNDQKKKFYSVGG